MPREPFRLGAASGTESWFLNLAERSRLERVPRIKVRNCEGEATRLHAMTRAVKQVAAVEQFEGMVDELGQFPFRTRSTVAARRFRQRKQPDLYGRAVLQIRRVCVLRSTTKEQRESTAAVSKSAA